MPIRSDDVIHSGADPEEYAAYTEVKPMPIPKKTAPRPGNTPPKPQKPLERFADKAHPSPMRAKTLT